MKQFNGVYPISGEDLSALPVKAIAPAVAFYRDVLGFTVVLQDDQRATVQRDDARLGLVVKLDHNPGEAGSCAFGVTDLDAMHRELSGRGLDLGGIDTQEWGGKRYRVFFLREAENGYCYCFSQPVTAEKAATRWTFASDLRHPWEVPGYRLTPTNANEGVVEERVGVQAASP